MSLKTLCLMRHSQAVAELSDEITKDIDKPLTDAGIHQLEAVRQFVKDINLSPDLVLCSPSVRTRQTLEWIQEALGANVAVEFREDLYGMEVDALLGAIQAIDDVHQSVLIIGHNPSVSDAMQRLLAKNTNDRQLRLPAQPAQLAVFELSCSDWSELVHQAVTLTGVFDPAYEA